MKLLPIWAVALAFLSVFFSTGPAHARGYCPESGLDAPLRYSTGPFAWPAGVPPEFRDSVRSNRLRMSFSFGGRLIDFHSIKSRDPGNTIEYVNRVGDLDVRDTPFEVMESFQYGCG